jgi:excisionase family DNA binding protein
MPDYMTTAEVAELLRRPVETLRYWRWRGEGPPSFKIGRRVLYARTDVEHWIADRRVATHSG